MNHTVGGDEIRERASLYALGALSQHEARAFEEHLAEGCEACEDELRSFEGVTEALAFASTAVAPPAGAREKLLGQLAQNGSARKPARTSAVEGARQFLTVREDEGTWQQMFDGIQVKRLFVDRGRGTVTSLYKFEPGAQIPPHPHSGVEECYVLEGDLEANGEVLGSGDYTCAPAGSFHPTVRTQGGALALIIEQASRAMLGGALGA
ncbi:MAG TPA: cupin domain-containing protein [Pyrinomonadaceae bacterium]|nr:cupin domain-containing protein [Pyrinomonadaceae bacterium]